MKLLYFEPTVNMGLRIILLKEKEKPMICFNVVLYRHVNIQRIFFIVYIFIALRK